MNSAVLLFATLCFHNSGLSDAQVAPTMVPAVTVPPVATGPCTPTKSCANSLAAPPITIDRGICVSVAGVGPQCWDACDDKHAVQDYAGTETDESERTGIAMIVQAARTVQSKCPGFDWKSKVQCNPGERCTAVTLYRGICATTGGAHQCLDMCDTSIPLTSYSSGAAEKEGNTMLVQAVRGNHDPQGLTTCPGATVWLWLWFPILLCCCVGCLFGWYTVYMRWKRIAKRSTQMQQDDQFDDYQQDYQMDTMGPPTDMGGGPEYMPVANQDMEMQQSRELGEDPMPVMPPVEETPLPPAPPPATNVAPMYPQPTTTYQQQAPQVLTSMAAPSTFYNSHQINPMASMYSTGVQQPMMMPAMGMPGTVMPGTMSYRLG